MTRISRGSEAILARTAFDTAKSGATHSLRDFLFLEILREEGSLAYQIYSPPVFRTGRSSKVRLRVEQEIAAQPAEGADPATYYKGFRRGAVRGGGRRAGPYPRRTRCSAFSPTVLRPPRVLEMFHVTPEVAASEMQRYVGPAEEAPIRVEVRMLEADDRREERDESLRLLEKFGADLARAWPARGASTPWWGREHEIERVVQILSRRKKNNPILIGEAGVGKSAVVEGLALRIASGDVPCTIAGKTIFSLDVSSLVAGTKFRGEFEERMQQLIDTLRKAKIPSSSSTRYTIVGAGSTQGSLDTANILKPALARGELQTIGATTLDEYREIIESDPALERRFQRVLVEPATPDQTRLILRGVAPTTSATTRCATPTRRCRRAWR